MKHYNWKFSACELVALTDIGLDLWNAKALLPTIEYPRARLFLPFLTTSARVETLIVSSSFRLSSFKVNYSIDGLKALKIGKRQLTHLLVDNAEVM